MGREYKNFDLLEVKATSEEGTFSGYASVFGNRDAHGDVVMPGAFKKSLQKGGRNGNGVAMLYQHDAKRPIGIWTQLVEDSKGLKVEGKLVTSTQDGRETYELLKSGALKGLSIGYDAIGFEIDHKTKTRHLKEIELWEVSPVTFGANAEAQITNVKGIDDMENQLPCKEISEIPNGARYEYSKCVLKKFTESPIDAYKQCFEDLEKMKQQIITDYEQLKSGLDELHEKAKNLYNPEDMNLDRFFDVADEVNFRIRRCEETLRKKINFTEIGDRLVTFESIFRKSVQARQQETHNEPEPEQKKKRHKTDFERLGFHVGSEKARSILLEGKD